MNVRELREKLVNVPDDFEVRLSIDEEQERPCLQVRETSRTDNISSIEYGVVVLDAEEPV